MVRYELLVEHRRGGNFLKSRRFRPSENYITIGSSRVASIRLIGPGVNGVHASIEFRDYKWILCDLCSRTGTWVNEISVIEEIIEKPTKICIGENELLFYPIEVIDTLFAYEKKDIPTGVGPDLFHQVVRRFNGQVIETILLGKDESYSFKNGLKQEVLPPPANLQWKSTTFGLNMIQQRLVRGTRNSERKTIEKDDFKNMDAKLFYSGFTIFLIVLSLILLTQKKEVKTISQIEPNKMTNLIYDAKFVRQKKIKSESVSSDLLSRSQKIQNVSAAPHVFKESDSKVATAKNSESAIKKIKSLGLNQLVRQISKKAIISNKNIGRSISINSFSDRTSVQPGAPMAKNVRDMAALIGSTDTKFSGIETKGRGNGSGQYREGASLVAGGIGTGIVQTMSEETLVEGGLDKEVIAKYIERQLGEIRYCYERQLSANPDLYGKIRVKFNIGADGKVYSQSIDNDKTLKNAMVEGCILRRISAWQFPKPKGGTNVIVSYPFLFRNTQ